VLPVSGLSEVISMEGSIMKSAILLALGVCLLGAGCATNNVMTEVDREYEARYDYGERLGIFFLDTLLDLTDTVQFNLSGGFGGALPLVNVHFTELAQIGIGWFEGMNIGWEERAIGAWEEKRGEYGLGPMYMMEIDRKAHSGTTTLFRHDYKYTGLDILEKPEWKEDQHWSSIGARFHLFVVGAGINFNMAEIADFVLDIIPGLPLGLVLTLCNYYEMPWDFMGDTTYKSVEQDLEKEKDLEAE
jgi:hypothetical protein